MSINATHPSRAVARSTRAMVASPHALATAAGVDVLRRGGNAVDAAIATNAVLTVVMPSSCGIGGDAFWLISDRKRGVVAYNGSGRAPAAASAQRLRDLGESVMPLRGAHSVTVPGAVRSWEDVANAHGSRSLDELLEPAERYARAGFACTDVIANYFELNAALLQRNAEATSTFLRDGSPRAGTVVRNPALADSIAEIRRGGADAFYTGRIAEAIVATVHEGGSGLTLDDLAAHRTEQTQPIRLAWRGGELLAHPPNSVGATALEAMGMLRGDGELDAPMWNHVAVEAMKIALDDRDTYFGDPAFVDVPIDRLLSETYLRERRAEIDPARARMHHARTDRGGTVYLCVVDDEGNAVSLIESLYMNFGSGLVARGTGIVLHNRGGYFSLVADHPNELAGGKRPVHTLAPSMFLRDGMPELVFGTMGGDGQTQSHVQILHNLYERGLSVQQALDEPRWLYGRHDGIPGSAGPGHALLVESRVDPSVLGSWIERGHDVGVIGAYENLMGHASAIQVLRHEGTLAGGADPRADSAALGL